MDSRIADEDAASGFGAVEIAAAIALIAVCGFTLAGIYTGAKWTSVYAGIAWVVFAVVGQGHFKLRERFLIAMAVLSVTAAFVILPDATGLIHKAVSSATFLASFMILLALLKEAAITSESVQVVGAYLTQQPPGRRYLVLQTGGHALGAVLNFGALSLLGPLIQRGVRAMSADGEAVTAIREQRQIAALDRGFSWIIAWSPTAVSQALIPAIVIGADPNRMMVMGLAVTLVMFVVGWAEDRIRWRHARSRLQAQGVLPERMTPVFPALAFGRFGSACLFLVAMTVTIIAVAGVRTVQALMLAAPMVTIIWIAVQYLRHDRPMTALRERYRAIAFHAIPDVSPEALTLSAAGFCGIVVAGLVPAPVVAEFFGLDQVSPVLLYIGIAALVPLASNAAMPPIFVVTFIGGMLVATPGLGYDPTLLGLAFVFGWALNLTASPFGASSLVLSRATGIDGRTLSWRWNGLFSLAAFAVAAVALFLFSLY